MSIMNFKTFIFLIGLTASLSSYGQQTEIDTVKVGLRKNVVHGTLGIYLLANVNYERMLGTSKDRGSSFWLRGGYGVYQTWGEEGTHYLIELTTLFFPGSSHLEASVGFVSMFAKSGYESDLSMGVPQAKSVYRDNSIAGVIGYRFQKPTGHFVFRTGIGFPEVFYTSFGFSFGHSSK